MEFRSIHKYINMFMNVYINLRHGAKKQLFIIYSGWPNYSGGTLLFDNFQL